MIHWFEQSPEHDYLNDRVMCDGQPFVNCAHGISLNELCQECFMFAATQLAIRSDNERRAAKANGE